MSSTDGLYARTRSALALCVLSLALLLASAGVSPSWAAAGGGHITGRVLGGGQLLVGLKVEAISADASSDDVLQTVTSDETGHYTFSLPPGSYVVHYVGNSSWAPEYYDNRLYFETAMSLGVATDDTTEVDDVDLAPAASISGTVTTLKPDKPAGISVQATNSGTQQVFTAKTGSTGKYTVKGLPEGPYVVRFNRNEPATPLYSAPQIYSNVPEGMNTKPKLVWVAPGEAASGADAALARGAVITGKVVTKDGTPVAGCPVDVSLDDRHFGHRSALTRADGSFSVIGLSAGELTLAVGAPRAGVADCGFGARYYDADDVLGTTPSPTAPESKLGFMTTFGATTDTGTLVYANGPVTETVAVGPTIKGTPNEKSLLTAVEGTWNPTPTSFKYAWLDNGTPIPDETKKTYTPPLGLKGHKISVTVTARKSGAIDGVATSPETPGLGDPSKTPVNQVLPTFTTPKVGVRATAKPGTWDPSDGVYTYQWRNGNEVLGTSSTLVVPAKMARKKLTLRVVARNDNPTAGVALSKAVTVRSGTITVTRKPSISGTARVGRTLKYVAGRTSPSTTSRSYRWLRDGHAISGATRYSRKLTSADKRHRISLRVTYRKTGYTSVNSVTASKKVG